MSSIESADPATIVRQFKRLGSLTYQRKQLIESGHCRELFDELRKARRPFDAILFALAAVVAYFVCQTAMVREMPLYSLACLGITGSILWSRYRTVREVSEFVRNLPESDLATAEDDPKSPAAVLAARYTLSYAQQQMLKAGDVPAVARDLAETSLKNAGLLIGVPGVMFMKLVRDQFVELREMNRALTAEDVFMLGIMAAMLFIPCGVFAIAQLRRWKRLTALATVESQRPTQTSS